MKESLRIKRYMDIFKRGHVSDQRLTAFSQNPKNYYPKLHSTQIQIVGSSPPKNVKARWNAVLIRRLSRAAAEIVQQLMDRDANGTISRFGSDQDWTDWAPWEDMLTKKFYDLFRIICQAYPQDGESIQDAEIRLSNAHFASLLRKKKVSLLVWVR